MTKFKVGDMVIDPVRFQGESKIVYITPEFQYPILLDNELRYTLDGKFSLDDILPSLYPAGTKITIEEPKPVEWPWVNVYKKDSEILASRPYPTMDEAIEFNKNPHGWKDYYCHTIQLKPPEDNCPKCGKTTTALRCEQCWYKLG